MQGDKLASGAASATFTGPKLHFDEQEMQQDLRRLSRDAFCDKYMMTAREYTLLLASDGEKTIDLIREVEEHTEAIDRLLAEDRKQDEGLKRECFITPFVAGGSFGRIFLTRDQPVLPREQSKLALPRHLRKERERLPTTGHIIAAKVFDGEGHDRSGDFIGKRVLFSPMSGGAICFRNYPTWLYLDVNEIIGIIHKEDAEVLEEELEPLDK